ncbi:MAG: Fmu (Sun) domain-containing protein [Chitinophagaceae bacterium]|nr:Fmu (Sun) domain-containing protein [Chitinophagaceae bacterium]
MNGRYFSHLNTAGELITQFTGSLPFNLYLKQFFAAHKKYGSKDRRQITSLCYHYFRVGNALISSDLKNKIIASRFLIATEPDDFISALKPDWADFISNRSLHDKCKFLASVDIIVKLDVLFPLPQHLSEDIATDKEYFLLSHLQQPDVFLRIRPNQNEKVIAKLKQAEIPYSIENQTITISPNSSINTIFESDKLVVVQDLSSQRTGEFIREALSQLNKLKDRIDVWDCCAASGGKSLLAFDINPAIQLSVSDSRKSVLFNLQKRFAAACIARFDSFVADLTKPIHLPQPFPLIIADVPCSGSGTWGRNPEELHHFSLEKLNDFASLQKNILTNVLPNLKVGGILVYITCSVYKAENEDIVQWLQENHKMKLLKMENIKGYQQKADTMFAALLSTT